MCICETERLKLPMHDVSAGILHVQIIERFTEPAFGASRDGIVECIQHPKCASHASECEISRTMASQCLLMLGAV
jgi:hypothetical protein